MTVSRTASPFTVDTLLGLYRSYSDDLRVAREAQRELLAQRPLRPKLDDIEAELTYLLLRDARPATVAEIGSFHGWSTTWILRALRDNGSGHLHTFDLVDHARRTVPADLSEDRWTFVPGDVRETMRVRPEYLFLDAAHTARFARWYTAALLPRLMPGTIVSVHDVFHHRRPWPMSEGSVVLAWLRSHDVPYLTPSASGDPDLHDRLSEFKRTLRLSAPVHRGRHNPMLFFRAPST